MAKKEEEMTTNLIKRHTEMNHEIISISSNLLRGKKCSDHCEFCGQRFIVDLKKIYKKNNY